MFLFVVYLVFALDWTFASHLGAASTIGGMLLWLLEILAALLCCAYLWEICDALGTEDWRRRITPSPPGHHRVPESAAAHGQPARPGAQRAAGHGDRHAALAAPASTTRATRSSSSTTTLTTRTCGGRSRPGAPATA